MRGYNARAIGVELVNTGRYPHWHDSSHQAMDEAYTEAQIVSLVALLQKLQVELPSLRQIAGHEDLDTGTPAASDDANAQVLRKRDPGPLFPWQRVLGAVDLRRIEAVVEILVKRGALAGLVEACLLFSRCSPGWSGSVTTATQNDRVPASESRSAAMLQVMHVPAAVADRERPEPSIGRCD